MPEYQNVPGEGKLYKVGNSHYMIYEVEYPGKKPVYMAWYIDGDEKLQQIAGLEDDKKAKPDRSISWEQWRKMGVMNAGYINEIRNMEEHPVGHFVNNIKRQAKSQPWILEPDILSLAFESYVEGKSGVTPEELQTTDWWRGQSAAQRQWIIKSATDPKTAQQELETQALNTEELLKQAGVNNASEDIVDYMAGRYVRGDITAAQLREEIKQVSDPYYAGKPNDELSEMILGQTGLNTSREGEDDVRNLVTEWLGPVYGGHYTDDEIGRWASKFRNDPDAKLEFEETLKDQRVSILPNYTNRNLSYQQIAAPWRGVMQSQWGTVPDEDDPFFQSLVQKNDMEFAETKLRSEGLKRGVNKVTDQFTASLLSSTGGQLRKSV